MNAKPPFLIGAALMILGLWSYFGSGTTSITALIPTFFGVALVVLGLAVARERLGLPALYGVLLVALAGFAGSVSGVPDFVRALFGVAVERPFAASVQAAMAFFCFSLLLLAGKAVWDARRASRRANSSIPRRPLSDT